MAELESRPPDPLAIGRRRIRSGLIATAIALTAISFGLACVRIFTGHNYVYGLAPLLDLNGEANVTAWYSSVLLLGCAGVAAAVALRLPVRANRRAWLAMAMVFVLFSLDEIAGFHERFVVPAEFVGPFGPIRNITWVWAGMVWAGALVALFARTVLAAPAPVRRGIVIAGALYVGGALGMEILGGLWALRHGEANLVHAVVDALEEGGELAGASLFVDAALGYLAMLGEFEIRVGD